MKLWFVDDRPDNHATWESSFSDDIRHSCELRVFTTVNDLLDEFARGILPDVLFLDFFIEGRLGVDVIRWFEDQPLRPLLIAHSSMERANLGMVEKGADFYLEKIKGQPYIESIRSVFRTLDDIRYAIEHRRVRTNLPPDA